MYQTDAHRGVYSGTRSSSTGAYVEDTREQQESRESRGLRHRLQRASTARLSRLTADCSNCIWLTGDRRARIRNKASLGWQEPQLGLSTQLSQTSLTAGALALANTRMTIFNHMALHAVAGGR